MKNFSWLLVFVCISATVFADAGFNIRRRQALSVTSFSGCSNLRSHQLVFAGSYFRVDTADKRPYNERGEIVYDDYKINMQEGGSRWVESDRNIYLLLVDTSNNTITDSLHLYGKDYDMHVIIDGDSAGKLQYKIDSSKSVYQYMIMGQEEKSGVFKRNRFIFIGCSIIGFVLLILLFIRRKNTPNT